jgi:transcriptional regulator with PAS, ATPase and Fis domain
MRPILLLSPMQSISELAPDIAHELGISIHVETSDDASAMQLVGNYPDVEVVVTRGGLAEQVRQIPGVSVVEIAMSLNELLSNLGDLTRKGLRRIGIVSRANLFSGAVGDFQIADAQVSIRPQADEEGIQTTVRQLASEGYEAIIGCRVAFATARDLGIAAVFLESGPVSIRSALQEAMRIVDAKQREKLQAAQLAAIIDNIDEAVIAVTPDHQVSFFNRHARRICSISPASPPNFKEALAVFDSGGKEQITTINGNSVIARSIPLEVGHSVRGKVLTLHEVTRIQASESKIRSSFYQKGLYARYHFKDVIGDSELMQQLIARAKTYAGHDSNLLIYGETGTGKEVFAQSIHNYSRRNKGPFVSINIASLPPSLLESELFGYVDGAFTGARKGGKPGLFELAHQGTLFLDEIGELAPEMQSRFLRVLQEHEIMRIGDDKIIPIDVRIISATNRDLFQQTLSGSFRQDLYYRLHVVGLRIPPLRARAPDVVSIFEHYLQRFAGQAGRQASLSAAAKALLTTHPWPGNIRQLRNVAEVVAYGEAERVDVGEIIAVLGEQQALPASESSYLTIADSGTLKDMELQIVRCLLSRLSADEVCARLGISRVTLWRKMQKMPIGNAPGG